MGRYCVICGLERPNEAFSGRGHGIGICKKCDKMPKSARQRIMDEDFMAQALEQKNISEKNVAYFNEMRLRYPDSLGERAAVMAELGSVHPRKRKRYGFLYHNRRELFDRMVRLNMIDERMTPEMEDAEEELIMGKNMRQKERSEIMESRGDDHKEDISTL